MRTFDRVRGLAGVLVAVLLVACQTAVTPIESGAQDLTVAIDRDVSHLNPLDSVATSQVEGTVSTLVYEGLVNLDDDGNFQPVLAESWSVAADKMTWTFSLRRGVKFHDGTDFTAEAVVATLTKVIAPESKYLGATVFRPAIESVTVVDDYTVAIRTRGLFGPLLNLLQMEYGKVISPSALAKYGPDIGQHAVGTGPYQLESFVPSDRVVLTRNENYWGTKAKLRQLTLRVVPDAATRMSMLESGEAQVIMGLQSQDIERVRASGSLDVVVREALQGVYMGMNSLIRPYDDVRVRHAFNYALDKKKISGTLYAGQLPLLDSPVTKPTAYHISTGSYTYDLSKARDLLASAGWRDTDGDGILDKGGKPFKTSLWVPGTIYENAKGLLLAQAIQSQLRAVGVDVQVEVKEDGSWFSTLKVAPAEARYELFLWQYNPSSGDIFQAFDALFRSDADRPNQPPARFNLTRFNNDRVNQLTKIGLESTKSSERAKAYAEALQIIWEEAPYVWLYNLVSIVGINKDVTDVGIRPAGFLDLRASRFR